MHKERLCRGRMRCIVFMAFAMTACGGGGGAPATGFQPPIADKTLNGVVMLGPVANADVEISGTSGVLGSGTTAADGTFGPISYAGDYDGPLRIAVSGNAVSTWTCDFFIGCVVGFSFFAPGQSIDFDGTLEAVLPAATSGQFVSVSMLSNFAAKRVDVLGGLTSANVNSAHADIADTIRSLLVDVLGNLSRSLPDDFNVIELFDLQNVPVPRGSDDALRVLLTLLNSGLAGLLDPPQTTGEFIDDISTDVAAQPVLSVSDADFSTASMESLLSVFFAQAVNVVDTGDPLAASIDALLFPGDLASVLNGAITSLLALPAIVLETDQVEVLVDDQALQGPIIRELQVLTSTGEQLQQGDYDVVVFALSPTPEFWLSASAVSTGGIPHVRLDFDNAVIANMPDQSLQTTVETHSTTGEFRRHHLTVILNVDLAGQ